MTTTDLPPIPDGVDVADTIRYVNDHAPRTFVWDYQRSRPQLVTLYNKAMASQWSSVTELDWTIEVDPERLIDWNAPVMVLAKAAKDLPGSPISSWGDKEFTALGVESFKAQISQFVHGEQGAMLTAAKIVETVPWIDAKYYAATQTMDEARHTEVFQRYLSEKVGDQYPMGPYLQGQVFGLLEDSRWDIAYLGMQIIIESLALAAFGEMLRRTDEPLLRKLLRYVLADEARHVAFGILSLQEFYEKLCRGRTQGTPGVPRREHVAQPGPLDHTRDVGPPRRRRQQGAPVPHGGGEHDPPRPGCQLPAGVLLQAGAERRASSASSTPTTATSAACGATRVSSSTSSTTTPPRTTRPTTPSPATAPRQPEPPPAEPAAPCDERTDRGPVRSLIANG